MPSEEPIEVPFEFQNQNTVELRKAARQQLQDWRRSGVTDFAKEAFAVPVSLVGQQVDTAEVPATSQKVDVAPASAETLPTETKISKPPTPPSIIKETSAETSAAMPAKKALPASGSNLSGSDRMTQLAELKACVAECTRCPELAKTRTQTVFGIGNPNAKVMFVGEAPGADEDRTGEPFVGRAGQLLTKIIGACGWTREDLYICNILRCRPPGNRNPTHKEAENCREFLDGQIATVDPDYIVCWGTVAAQNLLNTKDPIGRMRGKFFSHGKAKVLCTYHPSYLLRNPAAKLPVWEDLQILLRDMGIDPETVNKKEASHE